ncbi:MAG: Rieske (2Fe-2S) protein [Ferrimicrobium sp.]
MLATTVWVERRDEAVCRAVDRACRGVLGAHVVGSWEFARIAIVALDGPGASEFHSFLDRYRIAQPNGYLVGYLCEPNPDAWLAAERAGLAVVTTRGAVAPALRTLLVQLSEGEARQRIPICAVADVAGRLGRIARLADSPLGPLVLFRVEGSLVCVVDSCPHAGASFESAMLESDCLTCPWHGSQFHLPTGERVRGPADADLVLVPIVEQDGRIWALVS